MTTAIVTSYVQSASSVTCCVSFFDQVRQLKVKVAKSESREKRRTQSLKGRESFQLSKDVEEKLVDLENKMAALGGGATGAAAASPASAGASPSTSVERGKSFQRYNGQKGEDGQRPPDLLSFVLGVVLLSLWSICKTRFSSLRLQLI